MKRITHYIHIIFLIMLSLLSCYKNEEKQIEQLLKSNDKDDIILGCHYLKSKEDTKYIPLIFNNLDDQRVSNNFKFKGISVHEAKMKALYRISGLTPPNKITFKVDTLNIRFYKDWVTQNNLIAAPPHKQSETKVERKNDSK